MRTGRLLRALGASAVPVRLDEPARASGRRAVWLSFNSVTEIGLLAITATQASRGLPRFGILLLPTLFMAGMTLIDSTDDVLMIRTYGWAMDDLQRKLLDNASITFVSTPVAPETGGIESVGQRFGAIGFAIAAPFLAGWIASIPFHRWQRAADAPTR